MGQSESNHVYADDGVTVIGSTSGPAMPASEFGPVKQRWFDAPGTAAPAQCLAKQTVFCPACGKLLCQCDASAMPGATTRAPVLHTDPNHNTEYGIRNASSRNVVVSCGGTAVEVLAGRSAAVPATAAVAVIRSPGGERLCEVTGLPAGGGAAVRVTIVVREVGGVVCAAMDYSVLGPSRQRQPPTAGAGIDALPATYDAPPATDVSAQLLEQQLSEAMQRNDEDEVRRLLRLL